MENNRLLCGIVLSLMHQMGTRGPGYPKWKCRVLIRSMLTRVQRDKVTRTQMDCHVSALHHFSRQRNTDYPESIEE